MDLIGPIGYTLNNKLAPAPWRRGDMDPHHPHSDIHIHPHHQIPTCTPIHTRPRRHLHCRAASLWESSLVGQYLCQPQQPASIPTPPHASEPKGGPSMDRTWAMVEWSPQQCLPPLLPSNPWPCAEQQTAQKVPSGEVLEGGKGGLAGTPVPLGCPTQTGKKILLSTSAYLWMDIEYAIHCKRQYFP